MPLYGNELDRDTNPFEAGLGRVVKLDKAGDFVGRAALEQVAEAGPRQAARRPGRCAAAASPATATRCIVPGDDERCGRRHQRRAVADAGRADRDGLRAAGRRRGRYHGRGRHPRRAGRCRGRPATVLQARRVAASRPGEENAACRCPTIFATRHDHEWLRVEGDEAVVGITEYAADELGDVVFVELPAAGTALEPAQSFGVIESVKTASDLYSPAAGEVVAVNDAAGRQARAGQRRSVRRGLDDPPAPRRPGRGRGDSERLLDAAAYRALIEAG